MQSLSASYGGQRRRDLSLGDWPALFEKYLAPWLVKETGTGCLILLHTP